MKLNDIFNEEVTVGGTSVASIGQVFYNAFPDRVEIYKRSKGCDVCVAKIKRKKNQGWSLVQTNEWSKQGLEHFGQLNNIKSKISGKKTISQNIGTLLKQWGISHDGILPKTRT